MYLLTFSPVETKLGLKVVHAYGFPISLGNLRLLVAPYIRPGTIVGKVTLSKSYVIFRLADSTYTFHTQNNKRPQPFLYIPYLYS